MQFFLTVLIAAAVFGICYLIDKSFTKAFRSKAQHKSGMAVRAPKKYSIFGTGLILLGVFSVIAGVTHGMVLLIGGILVFLMGMGLTWYYLSYGIFYDGMSFLFSYPMKKDRTYQYQEITGQKLYLIQGGTVVVELHMQDGSTVSVQSSMDGVYPFLDTAFAGWCLAKGIDPQSCDFHDPRNSLWFPTAEEA